MTMIMLLLQCVCVFMNYTVCYTESSLFKWLKIEQLPTVLAFCFHLCEEQSRLLPLLLFFFLFCSLSQSKYCFALLLIICVGKNVIVRRSRSKQALCCMTSQIDRGLLKKYSVILHVGRLTLKPRCPLQRSFQ